ncbi:transketolase [Candidatus Uhrbacteria bacterium RIFOXYB12_FULL_58_10]|uniref:Transketolase n=1 Tax=Candidatus Uhrbacteria bacterium RIFOXYB2_FULL_57_15 TaxID=1802422 RepID=A0A1F7W5P2_9BACT|nr:MAG: transketolase [Candidatus Uhrbacteria bacterium RIFOXYB12_FULL_58_10]OGL98135.1 MAG: transketolase [Candidatus Uhrbacteria bacterium RIFOXYB2_FULL_57_15]OGM00119.1 MAG: transketolase [Candidatus Uhrbacteria bacterium RIFOXYC12_FULL_57_11]
MTLGPTVRKNLHLHEKKLKSLEERAFAIREDIIDMLVEAGSGHSAGPLGMADIFTALYFHVMVHDPKRPEWADRDRFILSNGHICPVQYATLASAGYFPKRELMTLRKLGSQLQGHPERGRLPGVENTAGPLGDGSSQAVGLAYAALMDRRPWRVYCVMSDGELECGITWEAMLFAGRNRLYNCTFIIDRNNIQIDGNTEEIMPLEPLAAKFESFNLNVIRCAGNSINDFISAVERAHGMSEKPSVIIADTIPGYGVDFMEYDFRWHGIPPKPGEESMRAIESIRTLGGRIQSEHE